MSTSSMVRRPVRPAAATALLLLSVLGSRARAQDTVAAPPPAPQGGVPGWAETALRTGFAVFDGPLHIVVKGVAPGGGLGVGVGYDAKLPGPWDFEADTRRTIRDFWSVRAIGGYHGRHTDVELYARKRDMPGLSFYGVGNASEESDHTDFHLSDEIIGVAGDSRITTWLHGGARVEHLRPAFGDGRDAERPNVSEVFPAIDASARVGNPVYWRYQAYAELHAPPGLGESLHQGFVLRATYTLHEDRNDHFSFGVSELEFRQRFAGLGDYHRLTLHAWVSSARPHADQSIPFYMLGTLGGKGDVRSVHEDPIGSDGTTATLRAYRSYRFRDRDVLLLQAEYRVPIWGPVEMTVFADAGKVAAARSELNLSGLHADGGFSLSLVKVGGAWARADVAFGDEGTRLLFSLFKDYDL